MTTNVAIEDPLVAMVKLGPSGQGLRFEDGALGPAKRVAAVRAEPRREQGVEGER